MIVLLISIASEGATLSITPDKAVYSVGESIILSVFGDPQGGSDTEVFGSILFDAELATYATSAQTALILATGTPWTAAQLIGGEGFGWAFNQLQSSIFSTHTTLTATVVLSAVSPGILSYSWDPTLDFFNLTSAPGGGVTIVPEPATALLVGAGLVGLALVARMRPTHASESDRAP